MTGDEFDPTKVIVGLDASTPASPRTVMFELGRSRHGKAAELAMALAAHGFDNVFLARPDRYTDRLAEMQMIEAETRKAELPPSVGRAYRVGREKLGNNRTYAAGAYKGSKAAKKASRPKRRRRGKR